MNILVTGATGFVGSALVEKLVEEGHRVTVLSRGQKTLVNLKRLKVNLCYVSFGDLEALKRTAKGKEVIFHLAGLINAPRELTHLYYQANVITTKNLLKASDRSVLKSFVYCSSVAVYGKLKELPADENTPPCPDNFYGQSKYEAEKVCLDFFKREGLPVVIVRPTWIYGPRDKRTFKLFKVVNRRILGIIGKGKVLIHPIFVYDLVEALKLCAFEKKVYGKTFLIGGEEVVELNDLIQIITARLNKSCLKLYIPMGLAKAAAFFLEKLYFFSDKRPLLSGRSLEFFNRSQHYDISLAKKELGFKPKYSLRDAIGLTVNWYRKEGWL